MPCSNSFTASLSSLALLPFILLFKVFSTKRKQRESKRKDMLNYFDINHKGTKQGPVLVVFLLPANSDLVNLWNGLQDILSKIPVISFRPVSLSLKLEGRILRRHTNTIVLRLFKTRRDGQQKHDI